MIPSINEKVKREYLLPVADTLNETQCYIPAAMAASLASTLSPIFLTTSAVGPTNLIPASTTEEAKSALSDRKPYPG